MDAFFFDSSALVKLHINETGTTWVKNIADPATANRIYIARIAGVEVVSAITRRKHGGALNASDAATALADFRLDFVREYIIIEVDATLIARSMSLAEAHALRGYDAVQLAGALEVHDQRLAARLTPPTLISADASLNMAALAEGLTVDDPNAH
ncbi:MAG: type II toxin-antitoxin system VapC family toxin [Pyrinomonadaceae bacterium]